MTEYSILIGGKAGDGISQAGQIIGSIFASMGYHVYQYTDYPSLIRGGHNFCIIRASDHPVMAYRRNIQIILAFDQQTVDLHSDILEPDGRIIFDSNRVKSKGIGLSLSVIIDQFKGLPIMGNIAMIGALFCYLGAPWDLVQAVLTKKIPKQTETNLNIAKAAFNQVKEIKSLTIPGGESKPFLSGNEWIGLGLLAGGLDAYIAYPMTPSSGILHFLAGIADDAGITVYHPESEIAVILMALGFAYTGKKTAVGTSGGGFCLMTEGLSLAGQSEVPIVIVVSQRTGPSTGLPTYTAQSDLLFIRHAGQGEFPRWIAAPATPMEAYTYSALAVQIAWKFQVPAFILSDKTFSEGYYTGMRERDIPEINSDSLPSSPYYRYEDSPDGISPMLFPPYPGEIIKVNSYTHDKNGISTEEPEITVQMANKRKNKANSLAALCDTMDSIFVSGNPDAPVCIICWGSLRGQVIEAVRGMNIRIVSPIIIEPFPIRSFRKAMDGIQKILVVEESATGQIDKVLKENGFNPDDLILRYDGRPSSIEELQEQIRRYL